MKKNLWQKTLLIMVFTALFTSCAQKEPPVAENEIITQKLTPQGRTPITILVKYAFSINTFEKAVEEKFPEIDIIQVGNFTANSGLAEYEARMEHDDLTDIVMTWPVQAGQEYCKERLIDLSSMPLTGKYYTSGLDKISSEGKLYYLPGPSQIRGIVYNKTLFEENGWQVPHSLEDFISLCKKIEDKGIRSLQLGFGNPEVLDTAFVGYSYGNCYSTPKDAQWLKDYNEGKGSLADHFTPAFETFQRLIDEGILKKEDLDITYATRERMLFRRECAMVEDSVLMARMGNDIAGCEDEFALMPFFNPSEDGGWARLYPVCYIGLNKHLEEEQNKEKYALVMKIMEYISTPEGQLALSGDTGGMYSPLNGMPPPDVVEIEPLYPALEHGRCAVFPQFENAQVTLRKGLAGMLKGEMTAQEVIQITDKENISPSADMSPLVIGQALKDFTILDTGNFLCDAMAEASGCEIALFLDNGKDGRYSGKGLCSKIYKGDITTIDLERLMPDTKNGELSEIQKVTMTGEDLVKTLEYSVTVDNNIGGWFYYFSGLKMDFAPCAKQGERVGKITDAKGDNIQPERLYTVAIMDGSVPPEYLKTVEDTHIKVRDLLCGAIQDRGSITPSTDGRFNICQP